MSHKILFNGLLYAPDGTGISRYTEHLVKEYLSAGLPVDILLRDTYKAQYQQYDNVIFAGRELHNSRQRILTEQWQLRRLYRQYELVHFPDYATPVLTSTPAIATIHDMAMKTMRQQYTWKQNVVKNTLLRHTAHNACGVVCDSQFSQEELRRYYPALAANSKVIHLGVESPDQQQDKGELLKKWDLEPQQYFLYVGTLAPHKNLVCLIQAFALLCQRGYSGKLVIAGGKGWMYDEIFAETKRQQLQQKVIFTGYISAEELESLYQHANCFISISLYEGFGLPPLEAMVRGVPVIVSDIPVFHETVGSCGLYADPQCAESAAEQMWHMLHTEGLRQKLAHTGMGRARQFSWQKTAQETWQFYQTVLGGGVSHENCNCP